MPIPGRMPSLKTCSQVRKMIEGVWMNFFILIFLIYCFAIAFFIFGLYLDKRDRRMRAGDYQNWLDELDIPEGVQVEVLDKKEKR